MLDPCTPIPVFGGVVRLDSQSTASQAIVTLSLLLGKCELPCHFSHHPICISRSPSLSFLSFSRSLSWGKKYSPLCITKSILRCPRVSTRTHSLLITSHDLPNLKWIRRRSGGRLYVVFFGINATPLPPSSTKV